MRPRLSRPMTPVWAVAAVVVAAVGAFAGGVVAGSLTIHSSLEMAKGATESGSAITWWSQSGVSLDVIPTPAPVTANGTASTPSLLTGLNASYAVGPVIANHTAVRWDFQLKGPPVLTEFELTFTVLNLTGSTAATVTVYLETPLTAPSGTVLLSLFFDNGPGPSGFRAVSQLTQQCSAFGTCP